MTAKRNCLFIVGKDHAVEPGLIITWTYFIYDSLESNL